MAVPVRYRASGLPARQVLVLIRVVLAHLAYLIVRNRADRGREEGVAGRGPVAEPGQAVAVLRYGLLVAAAVELRVAGHAHVCNTLLTCVVVCVDRAAVLLIEVCADVGSVILQPRAAHVDVDRIVAESDLALVDLVRGRDALATVAFQTVEGVLAQLGLALLVGALDYARVVLLDAGPLHPVSHLEEQAGALCEGTLLAHDALAHGVDDRGTVQIRYWVLCAV